MGMPFWCLGVFLVAGLSSSTAVASRPDAELSLYRFYSSEDHLGAAVAAYKHDFDGHHFVPKQHGRLKIAISPPGGSCSALLDHLQRFSLRVMQELDYLSAEEFRDQRALIERLTPQQVTFLEMTVPEPRVNASRYTPEFLSVRPDVDRPNHIHVRQAALWIINGQALYGYPMGQHRVHHPEGEFIPLPWKSALPSLNSDPGEWDNPRHLALDMTPMPWQMDPRLWRSGGMKRSRFGYAELDLAKYPMRWEFGRAAQIEPEQMDPLFRAAMTVVQEELEVMLQGDPEQAFIFVKAFDETRMRRFRRLGFRILEEASEAPHRFVMVAPFEELAKRFPPGSLSGRVENVRAAFGPKASHEGALNFLRRIQTAFRAELDMIAPEFGIRQISPVVVHDFSRNYYLTLEAVANLLSGGRISRSDLTKHVHRLASEYRNDATFNPIADPIPTDPFVQEFYERSVVRVSNLDEDLARSNGAYLGMVLMGVYQYLLYRYDELGVHNGEQILDSLDVRIALQTTRAGVREAARSLGCAEMPALKLDNRPLYTCLFSLPAIRGLIADNPRHALAARDGLAQGLWFFRGLSGRPMKF